jgi:hypothetical protein
MTTRTRLLSVASVLAFALASTAHAQSLAVYGGVEAAGLGESSALLGASVAGTGLGLSPVVSLTGQTYRYRAFPSGYVSASAISPLLGLQYNDGREMFMGGVGYSFVSSDVPAARAGIGLPSGTENGVFILGQMNHWGDGNRDIQAIASFAFEPKYLWSRGRAAHRFYSSPVFLGGEVVAQGSPGRDVDVLTTGGTTTRVNVPSYWSFNVGPTLQYRFTENFRLLGAAGARIGTNDAPLSGYGKLEFLALVPDLFQGAR